MMRGVVGIGCLVGLAALAGASAGCLLPGPESLTSATNVELIVTGARTGDRIALSIDGAGRFAKTAARDDAVRFYFALPAGAHDGALVVTRQGDALCAAFAIDAPVAPHRTTTSVNLDAAAACGGPDQLDDRRALVELAEVVVGECGEASCTSTTSVTGAGAVNVQAGVGQPRSGEAGDADQEAIVAEALSPAADTLFAGDDPSCPRPGPRPATTIELSRTTELDGTATTEIVDTTGCETGVAARLRARLEVLRAAVGP